MRAFVLVFVLFCVGCSTKPQIEIGMSRYHFNRLNKDIRRTWEYPIQFKSAEPRDVSSYVLDSRRILLVYWSDYNSDTRDYHVTQYVIYEWFGARWLPPD